MLAVEHTKNRKVKPAMLTSAGRVGASEGSKQMGLGPLRCSVVKPLDSTALFLKSTSRHPASERRGNNFKRFEDFDMGGKAGIWP